MNILYYENNTTTDMLVLSEFVYEKVESSNDLSNDAITYKLNEKLSEKAPEFHQHWKLKDKDLTVVLIGDSISTNNNYTTPRSDSMYRPPIMIEHSYPSYIEEVLRWDGQEYKRYDVPDIFTETYTTATSKSYDAAWDWGNLPSTANKPATTRVLEGTNCSVSYDIPLSAGRCDFIYRTDYLNAPSATVGINLGDGYLQVYDIETDAWVEANGYTYSAKEKDEVLTGTKGNYRESVYQRRLKMRIPHSKNKGDLRVTITNSGDGRLTYWGIQHSPHEHFIDFIGSARGGHNISALRNFERVDVDVHKPDLIMMQHCILNEGVYTTETVNGVDQPANKPTTHPMGLATKFLTYVTDLENKSYAPTVISYTLFHAVSTRWLKSDSNDTLYFYSGESKYTGFDYPDTIFALLKSNEKKVLDVFTPLNEESKLKSSREGSPIMQSVLPASGKQGTTWTVDGTHHNDLGARVIFEIMKNFFTT